MTSDDARPLPDDGKIDPTTEVDVSPPEDAALTEELQPSAETPAGAPAESVAEVQPEEPAPEPEEPAPEPEEPAPEPPVEPVAEADEPEPAAPPPPATVALAVAEALRGAGVRWAFTVAGESFLPLLDGLVDVGVRVVATRHEGGAAFMAEAVSQLTGRPTAVLGTRAVGAANMAIGIHTARADSAPLFALVGQVRREHLGREAFQEADVAGSIGRLAKWASEVRSVDEVRGVLTEATRQALGDRPGPVVLTLPEDLLDETMPPDDAGEASAAPGTTRADPEVVRSILHLLAAAERPVIVAGAGVLRARCSTDLVRLAELLRVPVIAAWRRGDVIPNDHPLYLGMTGYGSPATVRQRLEAADAMLVLGSRLNEITTFGYRVPRPGLRWAHVDLEPRSAEGGLEPPELALAADARSFLRTALKRIDGAVLEAAIADRRTAGNAADRTAWEASTVVDATPWAGPGVHPGKVVTTLRQVLPEDAIVTTDAGSFAGWLARGFRFQRPGTFLGPTSGAMGYGLPAAIGAALIHRDRPVVAWTGDGGFAMTMAELETAVRERLRLVAIVLDNERYGMIRAHQDMRPSRRAIATDLGPIDFAAVARGLGADGVRIETDDRFEIALRAALASGRPTVLHLALDRRWVGVEQAPDA